MWMSRTDMYHVTKCNCNVLYPFIMHHTIFFTQTMFCNETHMIVYSGVGVGGVFNLIFDLLMRFHSLFFQYFTNSLSMLLIIISKKSLILGFLWKPSHIEMASKHIMFKSGVANT